MRLQKFERLLLLLLVVITTNQFTFVQGFSLSFPTSSRNEISFTRRATKLSVTTPQSRLFTNNNSNNNNNNGIDNAIDNMETSSSMGKIKSTIVKAGMISFITGMCLALPIALSPGYILHRLGVLSRVQKEQIALRSGQFCARWLLRFIPFASVETISPTSTTTTTTTTPEPSIWVCNHVSALDIFMLLATDKKLRGNNKRPIKIVYVSKLVWRLMFSLSFCF